MARLIPFKAVAEDDRGARHELHEVRLKDRTSFRIRGRSLFDHLVDQPDADPAKVSVLIRRRILRDPGRPPERTWWYWATLLLMILIIEGMAIAAQAQRRQPLLFLAPLPFVVVWGFFIPADRARRKRDAARLPLLVPVCIVCIYELSGVPADADGYTVCPECGAAWKLGLHEPNNQEQGDT